MGIMQLTDTTVISTILSIIGFVLVILLSIIGFFIRGFKNDITCELSQLTTVVHEVLNSMIAVKKDIDYVGTEVKRLDINSNKLQANIEATQRAFIRFQETVKGDISLIREKL